MAVLTGFEPAASTLTGWRSLQTDLQDPPSGEPDEETTQGYETTVWRVKRYGTTGRITTRLPAGGDDGIGEDGVV